MTSDVKYAAVQEDPASGPVLRDTAQARGNEGDKAGHRKPGFLRMMLSVMQASFGVQTEANRQRDFEHGSITGFVVAALIFTAVFVVSLVLLVQLVLP